MDWIASISMLVANFIIGRKIKWGWILFILSCLFWVWYALFYLHPAQYGLVPASVINLAIGVSSFIKWNKEDNG